MIKRDRGAEYRYKKNFAVLKVTVVYTVNFLNTAVYRLAVLVFNKLSSRQNFFHFVYCVLWCAFFCYIVAPIHLAVHRNRIGVFYYYYFQHNRREISSYRSMQAVKCSEEHQSFLCDTSSFTPATNDMPKYKYFTSLHIQIHTINIINIHTV